MRASPGSRVYKGYHYVERPVAKLRPGDLIAVKGTWRMLVSVSPAGTPHADQFERRIVYVWDGGIHLSFYRKSFNPLKVALEPAKG